VDAARLHVAHPQSRVRPHKVSPYFPTLRSKLNTNPYHIRKRHQHRHRTHHHPLDAPRPPSRSAYRTLESRLPRWLVNPPRNLRLCDLPPLPTRRCAPTSPTLAVSLSLPQNATKSLPARRGTHPAATCVALTAPGSSIGRMGAHNRYGRFRAAVAAGGDHNILPVALYLVLVDFASWTREALFPRDWYASSSLFSAPVPIDVVIEWCE
jgi:hypothetical protein